MFVDSSICLVRLVIMKNNFHSQSDPMVSRGKAELSEFFYVTNGVKRVVNYVFFLSKHDLRVIRLLLDWMASLPKV